MVELFPHQTDALREMKNGSVLRGGTGSGKSRTALAYYITQVIQAPLSLNGMGSSGLPTRPRPLYVITTPKKRDSGDWYREGSVFGLSSDPDSSLGGTAFTVDSYNNLERYADVQGAFFCFDESRLVGAGAWVKSFLKIVKHNEWILLSFTPGDTWIDWIPLFLAHGLYKNRTEFLRTHVVFNSYSKFPKVDHYIEVSRLERARANILVEMPFKSHTVRHTRNIMVDYRKHAFDRVYEKRWHIYEDRPLRDIAEMFLVMRRVVNEDESRLGAVMELSEKHPRLIIYYSFNYELNILRNLANIIDIQVSEWNGQYHDEVPVGERWIYLVQYTAGAEAWECITTDAMVFWSLSYSYKVMEQSKGRIDRLNTPFTDLYYYILRSNSVIDNAIVRSLAGKKSFNEKELVSSW